MAIVLALICSVAFGSADFAGGIAARRAPVRHVVLLSQIIGLAALAVVLAPSGTAPLFADLAIGAAAGVAGGVGLLGLYRGLSIGPMGVVSPITALVSAVVPVAWGIAGGERFNALTAVGAGSALVAAALISRTDDAPDQTGGRPKVSRQALVSSAAAGFGFGLFFVMLSETSEDAGLWPLVGARAATIVLLGAIIATRRERFVVEGSTRLWPLLAVAGVFDIAANGLFLIAQRRGSLSIVSILVALYPAATVLLARIVDDERLGRTQRWGLALGAVGVASISLG